MLRVLACVKDQVFVVPVQISDTISDLIAAISMYASNPLQATERQQFFLQGSPYCLCRRVARRYPEIFITDLITDGWLDHSDKGSSMALSATVTDRCLLTVAVVV